MTLNLPGNVGPVLPTTGKASPTLCRGDDYAAIAVGVDYNAYESGPGQGNPAATGQVPNILTGPQADVTVSTFSLSTSGIYGQSTARAPFARGTFH